MPTDKQDEMIKLLRSIDGNTGYPADLTSIEGSLISINEQLADIYNLLGDILAALSPDD
jgi:hypothetical protein